MSSYLGNELILDNLSFDTAFGVPILHMFDFPNCDLVAKSGCGFSSKYGDVEGLKKNILKFYGMSRSERKKMGLLGRKYVSENLSIGDIAKKLETIF